MAKPKPILLPVTLAFTLASFSPANGSEQQIPLRLQLLQTVTAMANAMEDTVEDAVEDASPPRMLEQAESPIPGNSCIEPFMAMGCRMSSQIPIWNQFAAMFTRQMGITCPL